MEPKTPQRRSAYVPSVAGRLATGPPLLLDGALGTELERRGVVSTLPLWSTHALLVAPACVREIHAEYARAGAEILTANTFRTQQRTLARAGLADRAGDLTRLAIALAREGADAAGADVLVAGSMAPLEDCFRPDLVPPDAELAREHREHAEALAEAGADLLLCETQQTVREARAAAEAARGTGLPFFVSFLCDDRARLLSGEPLAGALDAVRDTRPLAVLVNCLPVAAAGRSLRTLASSGLPYGAYPNLGVPAEPGGTGWRAEGDPETFARALGAFAEAGARVLGGCCGTGPAHLAALAAVLRR